MAALSSYTPIATHTLATAASSYTFSSIPATYTDLFLVVNAATGVNDIDMYIQVNSDTGSNYSWTRLVGTGSATVSSRTSNSTLGYRVGSMSGSNVGQNNAIVHFQNYSNTTTYKTILARGNNASLLVDAFSGLWRSTVAINSMTINTQSGNFSVGSTFSLYGIANTTAGAKATGGVITSDSDYFYHSFYATDTFTPSSAITADILTLAGGGGGGSGGGAGGGGGGAGGYVYTSGSSLTSGTAYTCTVGAGGPGASVYTANPTTSNGVNSNVTGTGLSLTAAVGGGAGGNYTTTYANGATGGSGGGGSAYRSDTGGVGSGGSPTASQGFAGGNGFQGTAYTGGGGGGAGAVGQVGQNLTGGAGGIGINTYSSFYAGVDGGYIAGGGGGGSAEQGNAAAAGGLGGGGRGQLRGSIDATAGKANTGGGGGGFAAVNGTPGAGGSGVVIIRYAR
jgi:hypothetical protein